MLDENQGKKENSENSKKDSKNIYKPNDMVQNQIKKKKSK